MRTRIGTSAGKSAKMGPGCLILFAVPFAGVGLFMLWMVAQTLLNWAEMRSWQETPATITWTKLEEHRGEDATTHFARARYSYTFNGREYTGDRVSLDKESDNIGEFQRDAYDRLTRHKESGEPFPCYVNPDRPEESILYRGFRIEKLGFFTIFVLAFGGAGFGLMFYGIVAYSKAKRENALIQDNPGKPWLHKEEWHTGRIKSSSKMLLIASIVFAAFWNVISCPLLFFLPGEVLEKGNKLALLGLLFPAIGLGLVVWAIYNITRWRKYGESVFELASVPGVIGGKLAGVIHIDVNIVPQEGFHLRLVCINKVTTGSGKNRSTHEHIRYEDPLTITRELRHGDADRSAIPVLFGIPYDSQQTDASSSDNEIIWRLEVKAHVPGVDYSALFEVPVFKTEESSPDFVVDKAPLAGVMEKGDPYDSIRASGIVVEPIGGGATRIIFPMARNKGMAVGITVFAMIWTGAIFLMFHLGAPWFFAIIFILVDVGIILGALGSWFSSGCINVSHASVSFVRKWVGIGKEYTIERDRIDKIKTEISSQSGNTVYYKAVIHTSDQEEFTVASGIKGRAAADTILKILES